MTEARRRPGRAGQQVPASRETGPSSAGCRDQAPAGTRRRLPFGARFVSTDRSQPSDPQFARLSSAQSVSLVTSLIGIKRKSIDLVIDEN